MTKDEKTIRVCDECGTPLIWTFAFDYQERYCLNCGVGGVMLGFGHDEPMTRELAFQKKLVTAIWKVIYGKKGLIPSSAQRNNCVKCIVGKDPHYKHMTKAEKEWDSLARKYLVQLKGFLDSKEDK